MNARLSRKRMNQLCLAGLMAVAISAVLPAAAAPAECPQPRFTGKAPDEYYSKVNPLVAAKADPKAGESLFQGNAGPSNCAICHGVKGDGKGILASQYDPPPRNFSCAMTINGVPDGQLFWIIRFGSPGTAMPPHPALKDDQIWQLVMYLRQLSK
ncbi:MAG: cytochrome c [Betaproteobacteria bacterium]